MITFDTLRIDENYKCLQVDCRVDDGEAYSKVFIQSVWLDLWKDRDRHCPGTNAVQIWPESGSNSDASVREVSVDVIPAQLGKGFGTSTFAGGLFYVFVEWGGTPDVSCLACGEDEEYAMGVVPDWRRVYEEGMSLARAVVPCGGRCPDRDSFTDWLLRFAAFKLAVATCDFDAADEAWGTLFRGGRDYDTKASGCGCHR